MAGEQTCSAWQGVGARVGGGPFLPLLFWLLPMARPDRTCRSIPIMSCATTSSCSPPACPTTGRHGGVLGPGSWGGSCGMCRGGSSAACSWGLFGGGAATQLPGYGCAWGLPAGGCWGGSWRAAGELRAVRGMGLLHPGGAWRGSSPGSAGLRCGPAFGSIPAAGGSAPRPAGSLGHGCLGLQHPRLCRTTPVPGSTLLARAAPSPSHTSTARAEPRGQRWPPPCGLARGKLLSSPSWTRWLQQRGKGGEKCLSSAQAPEPGPQRVPAPRRGVDGAG